MGCCFFAKEISCVQESSDKTPWFTRARRFYTVSVQYLYLMNKLSRKYIQISDYIVIYYMTLYWTCRQSKIKSRRACRLAPLNQKGPSHCKSKLSACAAAWTPTGEKNTTDSYGSFINKSKTQNPAWKYIH